MTAPAAMPSVEDVALAIKRAQLGGRAELSKEGPWREHEFKPARAILDIFAPILAEKEREIATFDSREAEWNEAIANSLQNEEDAHRKLEDAEAALAAERGRIADGLQAQADALWERCETKRTDPPSIDEQADAAQAFALQKAAAAIRAQGE